MGNDLHHATSRVANRLRLRQVTLLLAIEQHGSLRHAAQELGLSQPAATKMLQELEAALGVTLFGRKQTGLVLNTNGEIVLKSFREVRSTLSALMHRLSIQQSEGKPSTFCIGHTDSETSALVAQAIREMQRNDHQLLVQCQHLGLSSAFATLAQGDVDCVIGTEPKLRADDVPGQLHFTRIGQAGFTVLAAAGHPLAHMERRRAAPLAWARALQWPWVIPSRCHPAYAFLQMCLDWEQLQMPRGSTETSTLMAATQIASQGDAVVLWPSQALSQNSMVNRWTQWPLQAVLPSAWGVWTRKTTQLGSRADYFVQILRDLEMGAQDDAPVNAGDPPLGINSARPAWSAHHLIQLNDGQQHRQHNQHHDQAHGHNQKWLQQRGQLKGAALHLSAELRSATIQHGG